jgi:hypothetical protein
MQKGTPCIKYLRNRVSRGIRQTFGVYQTADTGKLFHPLPDQWPDHV